VKLAATCCNRCNLFLQVFNIWACSESPFTSNFNTSYFSPMRWIMDGLLKSFSKECHHLLLFPLCAL
jgi:hypothetical protein